MHLQSQIQPLMAPTCINASLHTQNALNQLKSSALLTHSKCTQPTQIKCSPYALNQLKSGALFTHSECTQPSQMKYFSLHTQNALNQLKSQLKSRLPMLECGHMHIQCFEIPPKSTNPALVHLQTRDGFQNLEAPPKLLKTPPRVFKTPPRLQKHLQEPSRSENLHLQQTQNLKISLNAHKQSNL